MARLELVLAQPINEHAELIFNWRNDPVTRANSYHSEPKHWDSFREEYYSTYFLFPDLPPLFGQFEGEFVAFLHFDPVADFAYKGKGRRRRCCSISINLAPHARGKGIGSSLLKMIKFWIKQQGYEALYAEVKVDNLISQKAFLKAGFNKLEECNVMIDNSNEVSIIRYVAEFTSLEKIPSKVFIIAEAGSNWRMGSYKRDLLMAKTLISIAAESGADAVKFQVFRPETIYVKNAGSSDYLKDLNVQDSMGELFSDLMMPYEMIAELHEECKRSNIEFMATPFSKADFLAVDPYVKRHKIASYELNHPHLLSLAAKSGKPLILSTGASTEEEIDWAVETFHQNGGAYLTLLQCTAAYPTPPSSLNLHALVWLKQRFKVDVGLSDHSECVASSAVWAVALGASVIEKHFTLNNLLPGPDHSFALEPLELKAMVTAIRKAEQMGGSYIKEVDPVEFELRNFARRGIQAIKEIGSGDIFQEGENIAILRPGRQPLGIHPKYIITIEGKRAARAIGLGEGIQFGDFL